MTMTAQLSARRCSDQECRIASERMALMLTFSKACRGLCVRSLSCRDVACRRRRRHRRVKGGRPSHAVARTPRWERNPPPCPSVLWSGGRPSHAVMSTHAHQRPARMPHLPLVTRGRQTESCREEHACHFKVSTHAEPPNSHTTSRKTVAQSLFIPFPSRIEFEKRAVPQTFAADVAASS